MKYTLIAYRPDWTDYCRGCVMGGTSSECRIYVFDDRADLILKIADLMVENIDDRIYGEFEFALIINGYTFNLYSDIEIRDNSEDDYNEELEQEAFQIYHEAKERKEEQYKINLACKKAAEEAMKRQQEAAAKVAQEKREREEYERLRAKYGD